jgi:hypothetical protein
MGRGGIAAGGMGLVLMLASCGGPMEVDVPTTTGADTAACEAFAADLPDTLADKERVDVMLTHFENAIRAARQFSTAEGEAALAVFAGVIDQGRKGAEIAHSYGLDVCSLVPVIPSEQEFVQSDAFREAVNAFADHAQDPDRKTLHDALP